MTTIITVFILKNLSSTSTEWKNSVQYHHGEDVLINFETPFLKNATASISSISMHYEHLYQKFWSPASTQNMPSSASVASDALLPFPSLVLVVMVAHSRHSHLASRSHAQTDNVARVPPIESEKLPTSVQRVSKQTRHHKPITILNFEVQHDIKLLPSCCSNLLLSPVNTHIHKQKNNITKKIQAYHSSELHKIS